jgi:holo-[acyl-carrier protein] synthase
VIIGVGLDLVDIARVKKLIAAKGDRALARLFTEREVSYAMTKRQPYIHLAARIAAKEATYKALSGTADARGIGWREMEVISDAMGRPSLLLHEAAARRAAVLGVVRSWLTLSHSERTAGAVVVLEGEWQTPL